MNLQKINVPTLTAALVLFLFSIPGSATEPADDLRLGNEAFDRGDLVTAMGHYRSAAANDVADAQVRLAWILDQAEENEQAAEWYRRAADQGHPEGLSGLAQMYAKGEGVAKDPVMALQLFHDAANAGSAAAMAVLAAAYEKGELGVEPDARQAEDWRSRLAAANAGAEVE